MSAVYALNLNFAKESKREEEKADEVATSAPCRSPPARGEPDPASHFQTVRRFQ